MASPSITIPDVDPQIAQKLQQIVTAIDTATGKMNTGSSGIATTKTSVNNAVTSIEGQDSGQMVTQLAHYWPNTAKDGTKAHDALTGVVGQLNTLKGAINENLPAIQKGLSAIQTAKADQAKSSSLTTQAAQELQSQINGLVTGMRNIVTASSTASSGIGGITIGGACATGLTATTVPVVLSTPAPAPASGNPSGNNKGGSTGGSGGSGGGVTTGGGGGGGTPPGGPPPGGGTGTPPGGPDEPSFIAKWLARLAGPGMRALAKAIDGLPTPLQKAVATLIGGAGNAFPSALTSGLTSGSTLSTFFTAALGSLTGSYVVDALAAAVGETTSATTITTLTIAGGIGMGSLTVYVIKPLVLDHIFPPSKGTPAPTPRPAVVVTSNPHPGERVTTIIQSDGSKEIIDIKPNGEEIITREDAHGKVVSTQTVPVTK